MSRVEPGRDAANVPLRLPGTLIAGRWRQSASWLEDRNPARPAEVVALVSTSTREEVDEAVRAAKDAAADWSRTPAQQRASVLLRAADALEAKAEDLAVELTREEGKTLAEGRAEVQRAVIVLQYFAGDALQPIGDVLPGASATRLLYSVREPIGVVGVIAPWNFPIAIPAWKIAPALAYGNTVVFKPSELTPLLAVRLVEALVAGGLPPGVLNLVNGGADVGRALVEHPGLDGLTFTGSPEVGAAIRQAVAPRNVKLQLELGGKNPVVVLDDADLDLAVDRTVLGAMSASGQKCTATSRALVVRSHAEEFADRLVARVAQLRLGDPLDPGVDLGPLVSGSQFERVGSYLRVARQEGHRVAAGGAASGGADRGWFVEPTVLLDVDPGSRIGREEIFGPLVAVMPVRSLDEAVAIANATPYGLSASVFTKDLQHALRFVRDVRAGVVHVNSETTGAETQAPFGGMKASSSHSREQGKSAVHFFTDTKTVYLDPA
jgi:alpha-ketoglutaric semialdehyde dehydrogenase